MPHEDTTLNQDCNKYEQNISDPMKTQALLDPRVLLCAALFRKQRLTSVCRRSSALLPQIVTGESEPQRPPGQHVRAAKEVKKAFLLPSAFRIVKLLRQFVERVFKCALKSIVK